MGIEISRRQECAGDVTASCGCRTKASLAGDCYRRRLMERPPRDREEGFPCAVTRSNQIRRPLRQDGIPLGPCILLISRTCQDSGQVGEDSFANLLDNQKPHPDNHGVGAFSDRIKKALPSLARPPDWFGKTSPGLSRPYGVRVRMDAKLIFSSAYSHAALICVPLEFRDGESVRCLNHPDGQEGLWIEPV